MFPVNLSREGVVTLRRLLVTEYCTDMIHWNIHQLRQFFLYLPNHLIIYAMECLDMNIFNPQIDWRRGIIERHSDASTIMTLEVLERWYLFGYSTEKIRDFFGRDPIMDQRLLSEIAACYSESNIEAWRLHLAIITVLNACRSPVLVQQCKKV